MCLSDIIDNLEHRPNLVLVHGPDLVRPKTKFGQSLFEGFIRSLFSLLRFVFVNGCRFACRQVNRSEAREFSQEIRQIVCVDS